MLSTLLAACYRGPGPWLFPFFFLFPLTIGFLLFRFGPFGRFGRFGGPDRFGYGRSATYEASALLATRYARGEMDEAEYLRRIDILQGSDR